MPDLPAPVVLNGTVEIGIIGESYDMTVKNLNRLIGADEELELHLLELAAAERVVARRDFISEALAHLGDAVGNGHAGSRGDVLELGENRLSRLGTQIRDVRGILDWTDDRLKHQIEGLRLRQLAAAVGTEEVAAGDLRLRLLFLILVDILDLVGAHELFAVLAHRHRIGERIKMARRLPDFRVHDDRRVETGDILAAADRKLPPGLLNIVLKLAAERTVIPKTGHSAVDFG